MKIYMIIALFAASFTNARASDSNIFPLQKLRLGMTSQDFIAAYPEAQLAMVQEHPAGNVTDGIALCEIKDSEVWDSALVKIRKSKVESWSYVRTKNFEQAMRNIGKVYMALKKELGKEQERQISYQRLKRGVVRSPTFVWARDGHFVVFSHSPVDLYQEGDLFIFRLTVAQDEQSVRGLFDISDEEKKGDSRLFQEAADAEL